MLPPPLKQPALWQFAYLLLGASVLAQLTALARLTAGGCATRREQVLVWTAATVLIGLLLRDL